MTQHVLEAQAPARTSREKGPTANMRILTLSTVFPNPTDPNLGLFIYRRMREVGETVPVRVIAPVPVIQYGNPNRKFPPLGRIPHHRCDATLVIDHVRWVYPPFLGPLVSGCLCAAALPRALSLAKSFQFDVIDSHFAQPDGVAAALISRITGKPFVVTLRGNESEHAEYPVRRKAIAWALRRASRVITVSERLHQFAVELGCDPRRVVTIPNGIDGAMFHPRDRLAARAEFGMQTGKKYILSAGYLIRRKGHHHAAEALRALVDRGVEAELVIAGGPGAEGDFEAALRRTVAEVGMESRVRFMGAVVPDTLAKLMSAADVYCLASSQEGWPNVLHEAMACGAPVVANDVGAVPEMVPTEQLGLVVPPGDVPRLAEALGRALARDWDRDGIAAWAQRRTWASVAAEVIDLMTQVVREDRERKGIAS